MSGWKSRDAELARSWRDRRWQKGGYELEYRVWSPGDTPDTGWYLFGPDGQPFGEWMARRLADAICEADDLISKRAAA